MSNWFTRAFGAAVADIRQRVVEEPYFGRVVTPRSPSAAIGSPGDKSPGDGLGWFARNFEPNPSREAQPGGRDIHGNEHSLER